MDISRLESLTAEEERAVEDWSETRVRFEWQAWRNSGVQVFMDGLNGKEPTVRDMRTILASHRALTRYVEGGS